MPSHLHIADDILVHKDKDHPTWMFGITVTEDEKYLVLYTSRDTSRVGYLFSDRMRIMTLFSDRKT